MELIDRRGSSTGSEEGTPCGDEWLPPEALASAVIDVMVNGRAPADRLAVWRCGARRVPMGCDAATSFKAYSHARLDTQCSYFVRELVNGIMCRQHSLISTLVLTQNKLSDQF